MNSEFLFDLSVGRLKESKLKRDTVYVLPSEKQLQNLPPVFISIILYRKYR